ncbi:MAG: WD repeat-containing JIP5 [Lasallia pustulata]|uniref:WD repeat-containing protein JIP5 n=1 Tax=Lasallia pustulata TaxID=136370 RepID=A0A5M8PF00_9LECA|nr:MAG: WD repeat-containing JIP5 [Lasallia pustulata]
MERCCFRGGDGVVKAAATEDGRVSAKVAVPRTGFGIDAPSLLHALSPQTLLLATDSAALHLYDLRVPGEGVAGQRPQLTYRPHDDYVSSLSPLPPSEASTSGFSRQWVSTGGTTLAVTDLRRGVLVKSEDQEEELLSSVFVEGLPAKRKNVNGRGGEKVMVGGGSGVLTLWEKGVWDDQDERIVLDKESVDVLAVVPGSRGEVVAGMGDGKIKVVRLGTNKVVGECRHDEVESVVGLGFEVGGRMISGGGCVVKVWHEAIEEEGEDIVGVGKRGKGSNSDEEDSEDERDSSSDEDKRTKRTKRSKRRKRGKGREQVQHVMGFKGMD